MTLEQKILSGFIGCAIIMAAVAFYSFRNSAKLVDTNEWVNHTYEVLSEFEQVLAATVDAETGMRGYVLAGQNEFLQPYADARKRALEHLSIVRDLTTDNPTQQENIVRLRKGVEDVLNFRANILDIYKKDPEQVKSILASGEEKRLQDQVRTDLAVCRQLENALLVQRRAESDRDTKFFYSVFILLLVVIAGVLAVVYIIIRSNLRAIKKAEKENADKNWLLTGSSELNDKIRGEKDDVVVASEAINHLCSYLKAQMGVFYLAENGQLHLAASYAFDKRKQNKAVIEFGEGLTGQAAVEKHPIIFTEVPEDYVVINSGLGHIVPRNLVIVPLVLNDSVKGVIEIGITRTFTDLEMQLFKLISENLAVVVGAAQSRTKLKELLEETQRQAEELEAQQEELRQSNEELSEKTNLLEKSEAELKAQQEELQQSNEELEEKANLLEEQKKVMEGAKMEIETKARELEATSKYKSEFLANMSHELRTPLNSILILSQILAENKNDTLGDKEVQFASNIYNSGSDLLNLINEILDLSKVEAGKMELEMSDFAVTDLVDDIKRVFVEVAKSKSIDFNINVAEEMSGHALSSDRQRVGQVLKNLLSNALKFTPKGGEVTFKVEKAPRSTVYRRSELAAHPFVIAFSVNDTGIGIPQDKIGIIFEAFQQVDGSTKRKYGGTGLGLSISRELANTLGGEIQVQSEEGKGSKFTLFIPGSIDAKIATKSTHVAPVVESVPANETAPIPAEEISEYAAIDDRSAITENSKVVLIMEDDPAFATVLLDFVRERGYKGVIAFQGNTGLSFARHYKPDAIMLDMKLPVMDGVEVLKQLKSDPELRHIPVQIISGYDRKKEGLELGAFDFIKKPVTQEVLWRAFDKIESFVSRKIKHLLIVEDDELHNAAVKELIGNGDVKCFSAFSGQEAFDKLSEGQFDCVILDLGLPDMTGFDLLEKIRSKEELSHIPIVVYTGQDLSKEENAKLEKLAKTVVLKTAFSSERLLDEVMLFLHRVESRLPKEKQNIIRKLHRTDEVLRNKKVLIVDDDIRNVYSLTNALEPEGMQCTTAENGKEALKALKQGRVDIVLMDVMMPEMDGYEATREIRKIDKFKKLPIIALTAKAMKGDREKCLAVGMSDYISKPLNVEKLLSLMRVWLYQQ